MICYKGITFCTYYKECIDGKECKRALTEKIYKEAQKEDMAISAFMKKPECYKKVSTKKTKLIV